MTDQYYLQDNRTIVGNCMMFWRAGGGYTSNVSEAEVFTKDAAIKQNQCRDSDVGAVHLFDTVKLTGVQANDFHFHGIDKMQHRWNMLLVAVGIEPNGNKYIKPELHILNEPRFHTATVDYFNQEHERLLATINPKHEKQAGWIATPFERDFTNDEIIRILRI